MTSEFDFFVYTKYEIGRILFITDFFLEKIKTNF